MNFITPLLAVFIALTAASCATERDILEIAKEHPLGISFNGVPAQYGDPDLAKAVDALADIPHPWTVPIIIEAFEKESSAWLRKLKTQVDEKNNQMWDGWRNEQDRCGHLATLLTASRDPRAAVALGQTLNTPMFPGELQVVTGLYRYVLGDPRFQRLPPTGPEFSTDFFVKESRDVKLWWKINKDAVVALAKASTQ